MRLEVLLQKKRNQGFSQYSLVFSVEHQQIDNVTTLNFEQPLWLR